MTLTIFLKIKILQNYKLVMIIVKSLSGGCALVWVALIFERIIRTMYTGMSYDHCWRHYQENVYWYELCSLLNALSGGCILAWAMLIVDGIIRRMYTGMSYAHCWWHYQVDVYWYEVCSLLKGLSGGGILVWVMLID